MKTALKEWAVVIEAIAAGHQTFLLRKGGIAEASPGFEPGLKPAHREFLAFPTWEHQHLDAVRPEFHHLFSKIAKPKPDQLEIRYMGEVTDVLTAPHSRLQIDHLTPRHIWTDTYIGKRYDYRPDLPLFVVIVRLFRLREPHIIPLDPRYAGCRSWVELQQDVPTDSLEPVIDDAAFRLLRDELRDHLTRKFL